MESNAPDDARLEKLEVHAIKTEGRLEVIERAQMLHGNKLDQIVAAVTKAEGRPIFDFAKTVSMVRDLVVMGSVASTLAVWLVITLTAANDRVTELKLTNQSEKIEWLTKRVDWQPQIQSISPKVDVPQR